MANNLARLFEDIVLEIRHLTQVFGNKTVLWDINLEVIRGQIVGLVGPSGCGKSTLLHTILGTLTPTEGEVILYRSSGKRDAMVITKPSNHCGYVGQRYSLFPDRTALENVALGLMLRESSIPDRMVRWLPLNRPSRRAKQSYAKLRKIQLEEAAAWLKKLKLGDALDKYPHQMSGGMCQRVAIAQALILEPAILLLDEPFGALDEKMRDELHGMMLELYDENVKAERKGEKPPYTIIIITHELKEAIIVGDCVVGLSSFWDSDKERDLRARGASSIIYHRVAPVFLPDKRRRYEEYAEQRDEINRIVFDPAVREPREKCVNFREQVLLGIGRGVLSPGEGEV